MDIFIFCLAFIWAFVSIEKSYSNIIMISDLERIYSSGSSKSVFEIPWSILFTFSMICNQISWLDFFISDEKSKINQMEALMEKLQDVKQ